MYSELYGFARKYFFSGGKVIRQSLHELENTEWISREELEAIQLKKIQNLVAYAYEHVPFYRKRYQQEDIHPQDIKSFRDFQALPYLTRHDVINNKETLTSTDYKGEVFQGSTSGSTGNPMRYIMEKTTAYWSYATEARCRLWYGVHPGDKMARILVVLGANSKLHWKSDLANLVKRYRYLDSRSITDIAIKDYADMLIKWQPTMFRVYPSALSLFAHYLKERGITKIHPKLIESTGEKITLSQQKLFHEVFNAPIASHYSSLEIFSIAYDCPEGSLHVNQDRYLELVDRDKVVNPGQTGDIVVTSLNQFAMPFIRYKNGDMGTYETHSCKCGRSMPVLREIGGRKSDVLVRPDGSAVHWTGVYVVMMYKHEVLQYQIYQPDCNHIEVYVVLRQNVDKSYLENICDDMQPLFGDEMSISVKPVEHIQPSSSGKLLFIISDVKPDFI